MLTIVRKSAAGVVAIAALGFGGATMADAAKKSTTKKSSKNSATQTRPSHDVLASDVAAKIKAAALEKVPGATVDRVEGSGPYSTPYHAHITTSDGTKQVVLVDDSFNATAVQADAGRGGFGGHGGRGHGGAGEKALTGDTKDKVEAAVLAKYPGATIERTETNEDSAAPYESHITTSAGKELEVTVSKEFKVVDAREHGGRP